MGALIGFLAGTGLLLLWHGLRHHPAPRPRADRPGRLRELLAQAGLTTVQPGQVIAVQVVLAVLVLAIAFIATGTLSISVIFALFTSYVPWMVVRRIRRRRQADLREVWPEVVDNLTSGVRAGLSLPEALAALGVRGPDALREPFTAFGSDFRATGSFGDSLDRLKAALADPVGDRICESLRVAREVGGTDLGRLLGTLSAFLREDARTRSELLARQSWSVSAARMAVAAPWLVLLLLGTRKETLLAYDTSAGTIILVIGAVLSVMAYQAMIRIGRLPEERRVLR